MRKHVVTLTVVAFALIPAVALGSLVVYEGNGTDDPAADVTIKIRKKADGKRKVTKVIADQLRFENSSFGCESSGRTEELRLRGPFRVKDNKKFVAKGQVAVDDPINSGELKVAGKARRNKVVGTMRFTFGKTGCRTDSTPFIATRD